MKVKVPLPDGFFNTPPLSDTLRHEYIRQGQRSLVDFVEKARLRGGPITWTFDHEHHGVTVYRGKDMTLPSGHRTVYLNVTEVQASLDEAAAIMSAGADGRRDYCATYHKDQVVDLKTLYPLAAPTPSHPHNSIAIKWRAISANNPLIKLRDMVFMEYCDDFTIDGVQGFGRCMTSIDLGNIVPDLEKSLGIVRCHMWVGGDIFLENNERQGYLSIFRIYQQDARGALKPWLVDRFAKHKVSQCMASLDRNFRRERVLTFVSSFLPPYAMVPKASRSHCALCMTKFTHLLRKSHCHKCGEVLCSKCNTSWEIDTTDRRHQADDAAVPWQQGDHRPIKRVVRVCVACTSAASCAGMLRPALHSMHSTTTAISDDEATRSQDARRRRRAKSNDAAHVTRAALKHAHPLKSTPAAPVDPAVFQITRCGRAQSNGSDFPYVLSTATSPRKASRRRQRWQEPTYLESPLESSTASSASVILLHDLDDDASPGQLRALLDHLKALEVDHHHRRSEPQDDEDGVDDERAQCRDAADFTWR